MNKAEQYVPCAHTTRHVSPCRAVALAHDFPVDIDVGVPAATDLLATAHTHLIDLMRMSAKLHVLRLDTAATVPYLSGKLRPFARQLAALDPELCGLLDACAWQTGSDEELLRSLTRHHDAISQQLGDAHEEQAQDWFSACYFSLCIWQEDCYRRLLGMPSLVEGVMSDLKLEMFAAWMDWPDERAPFPRATWEEAWEACFHEPSPFAQDAPPCPLA